MNGWVLLLMSVVMAACVRAQPKPCSPKDPGPYLATPPTLTLQVQEATAQELAASPEQYRAEVRLHGEVGGQGSEGIVLEVMPDYSFMNPEDSFSFVSMGGLNYMQMYRPLDRDGPTAAIDDDINVFSFTLKCSLKSNMSDMVYYDTKIFVLDVNDNDPQFVNLTSTLTLSELTPVGQRVVTVRAEDVDISSNLTYAVVPRADLADDMSGYFAMDRTTGVLSVSATLDYEAMSQGSLVLSVMDGGSPARTVTATVAVLVEDGDDQGPAFVYPGCWSHRSRCAWPKYTTTTAITKGQPISVLPVPNKVKGHVQVRARDLDQAAHPVVFSIASTIPPGLESMFTVTTSATSKGEEYAAVITPTTTTTVSHGFEIFLQAEEQSAQKRFEVAMIFFEDPNDACASGTSSAQGQTDSKADSGNSEDKYSEPVMALIVVVAILAAFVLCLALTFFCFLRRSRPATSRSNDVTLSASGRNGNAAL